jgi:hypothetical protein
VETGAYGLPYGLGYDSEVVAGHPLLFDLGAHLALSLTGIRILDPARMELPGFTELYVNR